MLSVNADNSSLEFPGRQERVDAPASTFSTEPKCDNDSYSYISLKMRQLQKSKVWSNICQWCMKEPVVAIALRYFEHVEKADKISGIRHETVTIVATMLSIHYRSANR